MLEKILKRSIQCHLALTSNYYSLIGFSQADIAYKQAKINLEKTKIKAPFSGVITDLKVKENHYVNPSEELMTLVNVDRLRVKAKILESEIGKIVIGRRATLRTKSDIIS